MFLIVTSICVFVLVLVGMYLFVICPDTRRDRKRSMVAYEDTYIAHRGLFNNLDVPENSLPAFARAVENGFGIELDVQLSKDGRLVVFHDEDLTRMCGIERNVRDMTLAELQNARLLDTNETIPLFEDALAVIGGKVPLIVEVKYEGNVIAITRATAEMLDHYHGEWCVESFEPRAVAWFRKNRPQVIRGQLSTDYFRDHLKQTPFLKFLLSHLMLNVLGRPDFIAYNHLYVPRLSLFLCRYLFGAKMVAWTIKNATELARAKKRFSIIIFDSFDPR